MEAFLGIFIAVMVFALNFILGGSGKSSNSEDERQLKGLEDGQGSVFVNGEHMTRQEAEDAQSRGELYDTYY